MLTLGSCWNPPRSPQLHWCKTAEAHPSGSAHGAIGPPVRGELMFTTHNKRVYSTNIDLKSYLSHHTYPKSAKYGKITN